MVDEEDLLEELVSKLRRRRRQTAGDEEIGLLEDERLSARARLACLRSAKLTELRGEARLRWAGASGKGMRIDSSCPPSRNRLYTYAVHPRFYQELTRLLLCLERERMTWRALELFQPGILLLS